MLISRRSALQGALTFVAGLFLPWNLRGAKASGLTQADHVLLKVISPEIAGLHCNLGSAVRVRVHRLYKARMGLDEIDGLEIEVFDSLPNENGYITYYEAEYGPNRRVASIGCSLPPERMDEWIQENRGEKSWVPLNFASPSLLAH